MGTKKIAFEIPIGIPQATVKELVTAAEQYLLDQYELKMKLKDNPEIQTIVQKAIKEELQWALDDMPYYSVIETMNLEKHFKKEIAEAEAKAEAKYHAEQEAALVKRQITAGILRMHPDKLTEAKKLLKAAGIDVTM